MLRVSKESKLSSAEIVEKAVEFFGPGGYGLEVKELCEGSISFEGAEDTSPSRPARRMRTQR